MARLANGGGVVKFVAIDADAHGSHASNLGHGSQLSDLPVAGFALEAGLQVFTVRPVNSFRNCVDANPGDWLARLRK